MKHLTFLAVLAALFVTVSSFTTKQPVSPAGNTADPEDSTISVVAYFCNRDTFVYREYYGEWKIEGEDTVMTADMEASYMINVTDSTAKGYELEFHLLDYQTALPEGADAGTEISSFFADMFGKRIKGACLRFTTDEFGVITGYSNEKEMRKLLDKAYRETCGELMKHPRIVEMKQAGIHADKLLNMFNEDVLMQDYVKDLDMMFAFHGKRYDLGETSYHEGATAKQYANDSYINAWSDPETGKYGIATSVDNYIPLEDALNIATKAIGLMTSDTIADAIQEKFTTKKETMIYNAYVSLSYFENGWPEEMTRQDITRLAGKEKIKQTHVLWERYSVGNH